MTRTIPFAFIFVTVLIAQTRAIYILNNVTVPSDVLSTIFFDEIQNNLNLSKVSIPSVGQYNSVKCVLALKQIVSRFPSLDVLPFVDSWGNLPSGILYGHILDVGNFDQCTRISKTLSPTTGLLRGQYCFASVPLIQSRGFEVPHMKIYDGPIAESSLSDVLRISIGICAPDICDPSLLEAVFQRAADRLFNGALSGIRVNNCVTTKKPDFAAINIVGIVVFSVFGALMALSTAYDVYTEYFQKPAVPLLLAFSVLTNGRKLFAISSKKSHNSIDCLTGIRVLSMVWVLYCHAYGFFLPQLMINVIDVIPWFTAASSMHVLNASVSVDTFLFISGLLIAWMGLRELDKSNGKLNVAKMYFHRYIRLTPPVAAAILFVLSINPYIGTGPFRERSLEVYDPCKKNWWSTLLYVQNYVNPKATCVTQTWYLAVDTQLYILSPLVLIPLWKWGKKCAPVLVVLGLLSIGYVIGIYYAEDYHQFLDFNKNKHLELVYVPTHTRYSVWLIGIGLGYFMHVNKNKPLRPPKVVQLIGWTVSLTTILAIIYGPYFTIVAERSVTVLETALYESLKRSAWAIALGWIVFACHFGFGGVINSFLSHLWWQPLGRLTYSMYLVHATVETINFGINRTQTHFSDYTLLLISWSSFGISLMAAIVWNLAFESPVLVIEKCLLGGEAKAKEPQRQDATIASATIDREFVESSQKSA